MSFCFCVPELKSFGSQISAFFVQSWPVMLGATAVAGSGGTAAKAGIGGTRTRTAVAVTGTAVAVFGTAAPEVAIALVAHDNLGRMKTTRAGGVMKKHQALPQLRTSPPPPQALPQLRWHMVP